MIITGWKKCWRRRKISLCLGRYIVGAIMGRIVVLGL